MKSQEILLAWKLEILYKRILIFPFLKGIKTKAMKTKVLLTALLTFLLVNGKAFSNSSLIIDVLEHPNKTYIIELDNGETYETAVDIRINQLRAGRNGVRIFKRSIRGSRRNPTYQDILVYNGTINIPHRSIVHSQLVNRRLLINQIIQKRAPRNRPNSGFGMLPRNFQQLKQSVFNESFDRDKLEVLNFAARTGTFNSRQVAELINLLSFDSNKLQFAKSAYRSTVDKQNYILVRDELNFTSSRRKLMDYINTQPIPRGNNGRNRGQNHRRR